MRRVAFIASILAVTVACDKPAEAPRDPELPTLTDLSASPTILFQVFGGREAPRVAPVAVLGASGLERIELDTEGWRTLDSIYFAPGRTMPLYRNAREVGTLQIVRGMYEPDSVLYSVPGCRLVAPHAIAQVTGGAEIEQSVELLAASSPLTQATDARPFPAGADQQGRTLTSAAAAAAQIGPEDLNGLDYHARWLRTGVGESGRTLLASHIDPSAGDLGPGSGNTSVIVVLAEDSAGTFQTSYQHARSGEARTVEFRRLLNYADLNGDGTSELVMEAWQYAGIPELSVLTYRQGQWQESFRMSMDWCVDSGR